MFRPNFRPFFGRKLTPGISALESGIQDLQNLISEHEKTRPLDSKKARTVLKSFKFKRELHSSAREMQLYLEKTKGINAQKPELKLRERIKR